LLDYRPATLGKQYVPVDLWKVKVTKKKTPKLSSSLLLILIPAIKMIYNIVTEERPKREEVSWSGGPPHSPHLLARGVNNGHVSSR
jgi:hypothetical protein